MDIEWKRASELFSEPELYKGGTEAVDINQGQLGDCYFLTVLGAAANESDATLISSCFYASELNSAGVMLVALYINGKREWVLVDDFLPAYASGTPAFVHSKQVGEIWPCLLEKAWAKVHGTYARVESGQISIAAQHVLGIPGADWNLDRDTAEKVNQEIKKAANKNFLMFASTYGDNRNIHGLVGGHAYEIVKRFEINWEGNANYELFMMRNPWGKAKYSGEWQEDCARFDDDSLRN